MRVDDALYAKWLARAPIYDLIFSCWSPRALVRFALTCRAAHAAVDEFKRRAYNINRHFSRFFKDPIAFRSLQAKTNTLVSGSNALQFLDRTFYPESDLDLYTHPGHGFEVAQFLVEVEGYEYAPREGQEQEWKAATRVDREWDGTALRLVMDPDNESAYPLAGIKSVWSFVKTVENGARLTVQIVHASSSPLEVIYDFHSTCVMNFISADAAYSLFPMATFEERSSLGTPTSRGAPKAVAKYVQRGWRIYFLPTPYEMERPPESPFFLNQVRWVGDKHTWVVPLDQTGVKPRPALSPASVPLTFDPVLLNGWKLRLERGHPINGYECHAYRVQTTVFRYNYAMPVEPLAFAIRQWAHQQGKYSHGQVSKEDWVWFDADLPNFMPK